MLTAVVCLFLDFMHHSISIDPIDLSALNRDERTLVTLASGGSKRPVFLVHDAFGKTDLYRDLARHLGAERPVYGLQPHRKNEFSVLYPRIVDSIAEYCNAIQEVQPIGPYLIGGSGFGGALAVEIGQQLYARGHWVAMVALFDSLNHHPVQPATRPGNFLKSHRTIESSPSAERPTHLPSLSRTPWVKFIEQMWNRWKVRLYRSYLERNRPLPQYLHHLSISTILNVAWQEYRSQVFHGGILLFRAKQGVGFDRPAREQTEDPLLGWEKSATLGIELHDIPGGHVSMLKEPNVQILVQKLQASLTSALPDEFTSSAYGD